MGPYLEPGYVLIISHDIVGEQMAGPGIRYFNLARVLSREFRVILAVPCPVAPEFQKEDFHLVQYQRGDWDSIEELVKGAKTVILNSEAAGDFPQLLGVEVPVAVDGYDPLLIEWLVLSSSRPEEQEAHWGSRMRSLNHQYLVGDFFVCASERQRDWWLGLLEANGRINPWTLREDPSLRRLIDVVPFGLPEIRPEHTQKVIKGVWPGVQEEDKVILWGGGLWPWLDPLTAIRAVALVWQQRKDIRLVFPGSKHPNPAMAGIPTHLDEARQLANQLGLLDKGILFGEWVKYNLWPNVLLESDIALTLHDENALEARLAFRTRVLDYIWASIPIVATRGDATSEYIAQHEIGVLVDNQDAAGAARAIQQLLEVSRNDLEDRFERARQALTWERVAQPLAEFCRNPRRAPDKQHLAGQMGNPFYTQEIYNLKFELNAYERRKAIRLLNWLQQIRRQLIPDKK